MEIPDYSYLREDLAKALTHKKMLWNDGMQDFSEKNNIPLDEIIQKIETFEDPGLVLRVRRFIDDYTQNVVPRPADIEYRREQIGTIPVEWIKAKSALSSLSSYFFMEEDISLEV